MKNNKGAVRRSGMGRRQFAALAAGVVAGLATPSFAQSAGKIVVYTAAPQDLIDKVMPAFEKLSKLKVEVVKAGSGELINRLKAEKGRQTADVIWAVASEVLEANNALFTKYQPENAKFIADQFKVDDAWIPFTVVCTAFGVNTKLLKSEQYPKTWADLANPVYKGKISAARPDKSGSAFIQLAGILQLYGEEKGWELYKKILDNVVLSNSSGAVPKFVNDGEAAIGLANEDILQKFKAGGGPVELTYPNDGTTASADGMALIATAPNAEGAKAFMNFVLSKEAQTLISTAGRREIRGDMEVGNGLPALNKIKIMKFNTDWAGKNRTRILGKWNDLLLEKK